MMGSGVRARWIAGATLVIACASDESTPPPIASTSDTGMGSISAGTGPGGACQEADPDSGSGNGETGFKFDVGGDDGGFDFPVTCEDVESSATNLGCEFWAVDLPNDWRGTNMSPPAGDQQFAVVVANSSSLDSAAVSIYQGAGTTAIASAVVPADGTHEFQLDPLNIDPEHNSYDGVAFRIASSVPITAYQFNPLDNQIEVYSNDASLLFPAHAMARDYTAVTGNAVLLAMSQDDPMPVNAGAFVSVVGLEDGTVVDLFATAALDDGLVEGVGLDRGRVFTVISDGSMGTGNLSGTRVAADKPVAVFSGNVATAEPTNVAVCCADHLESQLLPLEAWGTSYAVAPPASPSSGSDPAVYRVVGSFDETPLGYCPERPPGAPETIGAYETVTFETGSPFTIRSQDPDKPFSVTQFLESNEAIDGNSPTGDPGMLVLVSVEQFQRKYLFAIPDGYSENRVTITARRGGTVVLDDEVVPNDAFGSLGVVDGIAYDYAHRSVGAGSHLVTANVPFGITVVGYDTAVSYGYPGGAGLNVIAIPPAAG